VKADYEPFSPSAIYKVASFSKEISKSGTYYVAIVSTADETRYSIATGYLEEFNIQEGVIVTSMSRQPARGKDSRSSKS